MTSLANLGINAQYTVNLSHGIPDDMSLAMAATETVQIEKAAEITSTNGREMYEFSKRKFDGCPVCLEQQLAERAIVVEECGCKFCQSCLEAYVMHKIEDGDVLAIACPACQTSWAPTLVVKMIYPEKVERYNYLLQKAYANRQFYQQCLDGLSVRWCPTPDCNTVVAQPPASHDRKVKHVQEARSVSCQTCHYTFCFTCGEKWHEGLSCKKHAKLAAADITKSSGNKAVRQLTRHYTRQCPTCHTLIEKIVDGSCNHMICAQCKTEFCWLCGEKIPPEGHFSSSNYSGCPGMQYGVDRKNYAKIACKRAKAVLCCTGIFAANASMGIIRVMAATVQMAASLPKAATRGAKVKHRKEEKMHQYYTRQSHDSITGDGFYVVF